MNLYKIIYILFFFLLPASIFTKPLSLKEALHRALSNDYKLRKLKHETRYYESEYDQAVLNFFPEITGEVSRSNSASILTNPRGVTIFNVSGSMTLPVYDRANIYKLKRSESQMTFGKLSYIQRLNDLAKEIITDYFALLTLKSTLKIRKEEQSKAEEDFEIEAFKEFYDKAIPLDVLLAKKLIIENNINYDDTKNEYHQEINKLIAKLKLNEFPDVSEPDIKYPEKMNLERALKIAFLERVDYKAKLFEIRMNKEAYEIERSIHYPKLELLSDIRYSERAESDGKVDWSVFAMVTMSLTDDISGEVKGGLRQYQHLDDPVDEESIKLTVFDKNSKRVAKAKALSEQKTTQEELKDLVIQISEEVTEAYFEVKKAKNAIKLANINLAVGQKSLDKIYAENQAGRKDMKEYVEAKKDYIQFRIEYEQAIIDYKLKVLEFKWALGTLWKDYF